jgi:hypothetical protein
VLKLVLSRPVLELVEVALLLLNVRCSETPLYALPDRYVAPAQLLLLVFFVLRHTTPTAVFVDLLHKPPVCLMLNAARVQ